MEYQIDHGILPGRQKACIMEAYNMPTLTIKKFPEPLLAELKHRASLSRRSLTQEVLRRLETSVLPEKAAPERATSRSQAHRQSESWKAISGKWKSDLTVQEEVRQLYRTRTRGRKVEL